MEMLDELNSSGKTMIISTHDVELAYRWADQVLLMEDGRLLHQGPPAKIFNRSGAGEQGSHEAPCCNGDLSGTQGATDSVWRSASRERPGAHKPSR